MNLLVRVLPKGSSGFSVIESAVALLLGLLLMSLLLSILTRQRETVAALGKRAEALATIRTVRVLLRREARAVGVDAWRFSPDSLAVRAFRGAGVVCPGAAAGTVMSIRSVGVRGPDPSKDSVMVVTGQGTVLFQALDRVEEGAGDCGPGGAAPWDRWTLSGGVPSGAILVRYFEHGSYHLSGSAFRYRRGGAGRQPLTPETLLTPESRFLASEAGLYAEILYEAPSAAPPMTLFVARGGGR